MLGIEKTTITIIISTFAFIISASAFAVSYATYYQNFVFRSVQLAVEFDIDGIKNLAVESDGSVSGTIVGKMNLLNSGNKAALVKSMIAVLKKLPQPSVNLSNIILNSSVMEKTPKLKSVVNSMAMNGSSFRYNPDTTKLDIGNLYIKPGDRADIYWQSPIYFDSTMLTKSGEKTNFVWAIRIVFYDAKNRPVVRTVGGIIIHYNGPKPDGEIDTTCFDTAMSMKLQELL